MGDEEVFSEEEVAGGAAEEEAGGSRRLIPAFVLKILKWVALGLAAIIFIVTVVVITVSLMNQGPQSAAYPSASEEYQGSVEILSWYDIPEIRTRTSDENPYTVIVDPKLGYESESKKIQTELIARREQIIDMMRRYFSRRTASELAPQYEDEIKAELEEQINRIMNSKGIEDIVFLQFNVIEF
ncbi:MAG: flagellar basal body-associated FliL family protein [Spirochaetaceae bacterium]|nr:flagellar basal body-associated FliL family protein [Spirochaetaceae bacterium]MCF7947125.1 flagellar basal body-associated FliL family protein [Spirochaetia bacterium]MCF7950126.1 flagellar basal body-associated FliL family protein [Spirochaetaceae bacterium]